CGEDGHAAVDALAARPAMPLGAGLEYPLVGTGAAIADQACPAGRREDFDHLFLGLEQEGVIDRDLAAASASLCLDSTAVGVRVSGRVMPSQMTSIELLRDRM